MRAGRFAALAALSVALAGLAAADADARTRHRVRHHRHRANHHVVHKTRPAPPEAGWPVVSEEHQRADVARLVAFGTRHTLSSDSDPVRGIGAARRWAEGQFTAIGKACGDCLQIVLPEQMASGARLPAPARIVDVVAIQPGRSRSDEVVIVQAHIDSRNSDVMDPAKDAPGANDDGSGVALVLEAARVLSERKFAGTIVYAVLSGEEQGLYGGKLLATFAQQQHWRVKAVLNNDIVGNSMGSDGLVDRTHLRVFSEGPRGNGDTGLAGAQRREGGENDSPSRNLSRYLAALQKKANGTVAVRQVWRADRVGRGGDHLPFEEAGLPAVRVSVAVENYDAQHQTLRNESGKSYGDTIDRMDFSYLAGVTRFNIRALAALAEAPMPPSAAQSVAVQTFTDLAWTPSPGAVSYNVYKRRTDAANWEPAPSMTVSGTKAHLEGLRGDDWFLGVSAVSSDGAESPVASALPGGGFDPGSIPPKP